MNIKSVKFYSENFLLKGSLSLPYEEAPCIIALHGLESSKDSRKWLMLESKLYTEGYALLRFNFKGCGEGLERSEGRFEDTTLTSRIKDFKAALNFLKSCEVNTNKIGVIGSSFGGMIAIAAQEENIKALVTIATPYKIDFILKDSENYYTLPSGRKLKRSFYEDLQKHDLLKSVNQSSPILIIHGSLDKLVPVNHAYELFKAAKKPKKLEIIKDANHVFSNDNHLNKVIELSLKWFKIYL
ncbi:prolyl oligopeptidase family serine peptidase [Candidatus Bathyarchaeota archaeon]|nr:prolyl oligopeptidase family serine peptidase [Candidatus Bathyarchaeota archaeon]